MANVKMLQEFGNQIAVLFDDGTRQLAYPTQGGLWMIGTPSTRGGDTGGTGPYTPPGGPYAVIFPCAEHRVSDTFQDHVNRGSVNPGTDYIAAWGSQVWSVADGIVTDGNNADISGSGGRVMHIDHDDGSGADYLHLSSIDIAVGTHVLQGAPIAHSGASGFGSEHYYGAHLHISYRPNHNHGYGGTGNIDFDAKVRAEGLV